MKRKNETPEQRSFRLEKGRIAAKKRRKNETPEQRSFRLEKGRIRTAKAREVIFMITYRSFFKVRILTGLKASLRIL